MTCRQESFDRVTEVFLAMERGDSRMSTLPLRVEMPAALLEAPLSPADRSVLKAATFLGIALSLEDMDRLGPLLLALVETFDLLLDLRLTETPERPEIVPFARISRLVIEARPDQAPAIQRLLETLGDALLQVRCRATAEEAHGLLKSLASPSSESRVQLRFRSPDSSAFEGYRANAAALAALAEARRLSLDIPGRADPAWPGLPHVPAYAGSLAAGRAAYGTFPGVCPFPFTMIRLDPIAHGLCPRPDGPALTERDAELAFLSNEAAAFRAMLLAGTMPDACRRCALAPRIDRSLVATAWRPMLSDAVPKLAD